MAETAFQPGAFQKDAFQMFFEEGGGAGYWVTKRTKKRARRLIEKYERIIELLPEETALVSVLDPYLTPINKEEENKRRAAQYILDTPPKIQRVNWLALAEQKFALDNFERMYAQLMQKIKRNQQKQEEEIVILIIMGMM